MNVSKASAGYSFPLRAMQSGTVSGHKNSPALSTKPDRFEFSGQKTAVRSMELAEQNRQAADSVKTFESANVLATLLR